MTDNTDSPDGAPDRPDMELLSAMIQTRLEHHESPSIDLNLALGYPPAWKRFIAGDRIGIHFDAHRHLTARWNGTAVEIQADQKSKDPLIAMIIVSEDFPATAHLANSTATCTIDGVDRDRLRELTLVPLFATTAESWGIEAFKEQASTANITPFHGFTLAAAASSDAGPVGQRIGTATIENHERPFRPFEIKLIHDPDAGCATLVIHVEQTVLEKNSRNDLAREDLALVIPRRDSHESHRVALSPESTAMQGKQTWQGTCQESLAAELLDNPDAFGAPTIHIVGEEEP